jgi:hypothetical protein
MVPNVRAVVPDVKVLLPVPVNAMVADAALSVRPVVVKNVTRPPAPDIVHVPEPILKVLVPDPLHVRAVPLTLSVTLLLFVAKSSVPVNAPHERD